MSAGLQSRPLRGDARLTQFRRTIMKRRLVIWPMLLVAGAAQAHTHLLGSVPANKSRVVAPKSIELHFSAAARLTALSLQQGSAAPKPVALPTQVAKDLSVALPVMAAGDYVVNWRVAGKDGHVMSGKFGFTIATPVPPPAHKN
jgi:copper resistance protein C